MKDILAGDFFMLDIQLIFLGQPLQEGVGDGCQELFDG
jgi:hypothetical protein